MKWSLVVLVIVFLALHQDFWQWTNRTLVGGFLPIGLVYHAVYSVLAAVLMSLLVKYAWPKELDEGNETPVNGGQA